MILHIDDKLAVILGKIDGLNTGTGTLMIFTVSFPVRFLDKLKFRFQFLFGSSKNKNFGSYT